MCLNTYFRFYIIEYCSCLPSRAHSLDHVYTGFHNIYVYRLIDQRNSEYSSYSDIFLIATLFFNSFIPTFPNTSAIEHDS